MKKYWIVLLALTLCCSAVLTACAPADAPVPSEDAQPAEPAAQPEETADLSQVTGGEYIVPHSSGAVTYVFEAECTNLENKEGTAQSGTTLGREMATGGIDASNGGAVWGLNKNGVSVNFVIISDRDVEDAVLILRAGTEFNMTTEVDAAMFTVRVDPVTEEDLQPYTGGTGAWGNWDDLFLDYYEPGYVVSSYSCGYISVTATDAMASGFQDFVICTDLKLQKGANCISLITTNNERPSDGATFYATAPVVDCIEITTTAQLGLYAPQNNGYGTDNACTIAP